MAKETEIVYKCPFCQWEVWFNRYVDLSIHLLKEHQREALDLIARANKYTATKTAQKWHISTR